MAARAALEAAAAQCVFTTHTPVAAGHDVFNEELFRSCFGLFARSMNVEPEQLLQLARAQWHHGFNMTQLALNGARRINGVSRIHGGVSQQLSVPVTAVLGIYARENGQGMVFREDDSPEPEGVPPTPTPPAGPSPSADARRAKFKVVK